MRVKAVLHSDNHARRRLGADPPVDGRAVVRDQCVDGCEAGGRLIPGHDEVPTGHEELYLVTAGHAAFTVDGEEIDAPAGALVLVADPASTRAAVAKEAGPRSCRWAGSPARRTSRRRGR